MTEHASENAWKSSGEVSASPRFRTDLSASQVLTNDQWTRVVLGGASERNVNEFSGFGEGNATTPIAWDATNNKLAFAKPEDSEVDTTNYLLQFDFAFTASVTTLTALSSVLDARADELWYRFVVPGVPGGDVLFPLPDGLQRMRLGSFPPQCPDTAAQISYAIYANQFLRDYGLAIEVMPRTNRTITLSECVLLVYPQ